MTDTQKFYTRGEAAFRLGRCPRTLRNLQKAGLGPKVLLVGTRPAYPVAELETWLAENTFGGGK